LFCRAVSYDISTFPGSILCDIVILWYDSAVTGGRVTCESHNYKWELICKISKCFMLPAKWHFSQDVTKFLIESLLFILSGKLK